MMISPRAEAIAAKLESYLRAKADWKTATWMYKLGFSLTIVINTRNRPILL